jgi:hypothetical protein
MILYTMKSPLLIVLLLILSLLHNAHATEKPIVPNHQSRTIKGWTVLVSDQLIRDDKDALERALELLTSQLDEITRVVPTAAVAELQKVPLWFSPEYPGVQPRAEYHPGAGWLRITNEILPWKKRSNSRTSRSLRKRQSGCRISHSTN